ncbi:peptidoglycan DD-metalloendopeptidase family protein [Streptomyces flavofungini]|uniref:aggregation-promoting factor C-terminal-like domain-containing protein n=1 Tax=Streptomyces flavofungini TaxID=68200 RepID=UPI0034DEF999
MPAIIDIAGALQAQKAAQDAAATATAQGGQAGAQAARQSIQQAGAQQALAAAHRNAAQQIRSAEQAVADAVRSAAEANRSAVQQVRSAREGLASAYQQAADRMRSANEQVSQAEDALADAQRTARQAQQDLTQARRDAAAELQELGDRLTNAQLSERDATLSVQEARQRLTAVQAKGANASLIEQQRAQLAYDQAVQRLKEQRQETKDLTAEKARADKAGVEGSDTVKAAQERLANAQRGVASQEAQLATARQAMQRQQIENSQEIAQAQDRVAEAQRNVARTQEDGARSVARAQEQLAQARVSGAESVASAERQLASSQLSSAVGANQAAAAQEKYRQALAKLTPSARGTFNAFVSLRSAFREWSRSLQPAVMPLFTRALNGLKNSLPGLTPFVLAAARAIGQLQDRVSRGFKSPWWKEFKSDLAGSVQPAIVGLGASFGRIFKGMAGIVQAFLPHMDSISSRMQAITGRFAAWGTGLKGSPAFERFLSYAAENGPLVARTIGDISRAFFEVARALSPLSGPVLEVLGALARGLSSIATTLPWLIQGMYLAYIATKLWTLAMFAFNLVMNANPLVRIATLIVALVAGVIYAYQHFGWFRTIVQAAWSGIQTAALWAWNSVLKPVFDGIVTAARVVGQAAMWLWRNAIKPAFDGIAFAARALITIIAVVLVAPLVVAFQAAAAIGSWLWHKALGPALRGIGDGARWLYEKAIKPAFDGVGAAATWLFDVVIKPFAKGFVGSLQSVGRVGRWLYNNALRPAFKGIADVARWLYDKAIRPVFNFIGDKASWLYNKALKPAFDRIKKAVYLVGWAFGKAKDAIKEAFGKIKSITKEPVNFVIKWVYTKGIKAVWDKVAGFVGLKKLPDPPKLLARGGTVGDDFGPARPMVTNRPTAIVGEGNPRYPEFVIPTDPKYRNRAQALHAAAGTRLMADGGILGPLGGAWDWTKDTVGDVVGKGIDWAKTGADLVSHPSKVWNKLTKPILGKVAKGVGASPLGDAIGTFPKKMVIGLKDKIVDAVSSMFAGGGGGGEWLKPVNAKYGTKFGVAGPMWASGHHTGLDFPAATGTRIRAVNDGTVNQVASGGPYGNHVQIDHGGGLSSFYAHMSAIATKLHKHVSRGTTIGKVGSTGNTTGPHLHLEARRGGKAVDPMPFLKGGGGGFTAQAVGAAQRYAKSILHRYGWGLSQFGPLKKLWNGESGWRWNALNKSSGAYGIPQALPASKMRSAGADWRTNYKTQVRWGLGYIKGRPDYGSPAAAWSKWQSRSPHWYDSGGMLQPGLNLAYNGTGRPEPVLTGGQWDLLTAAAGGPSIGDLHVSVFVGDREITDIARTEVRTAQGELLVGLAAG